MIVRGTTRSYFQRTVMNKSMKLNKTSRIIDPHYKIAQNVINLRIDAITTFWYYVNNNSSVPVLFLYVLFRIRLRNGNGCSNMASVNLKLKSLCLKHYSRITFVDLTGFCASFAPQK